MYTKVKNYIKVEINHNVSFQKTISIIPVKDTADGHKIGAFIKNLYPEYKITIEEKGKVMEEL